MTSNWYHGGVILAMENRPIRVAQVVGPVLLAGVDTVVMNYYRNIDRKRIQFDFIMDGYQKTPIDEEIEAMGGRVFKVEPYAKNMLKSMQQYYQIFHENHYPIVHSHMNTLSVFPLFEAWRATIPIRIAHSHSTAAWGEKKKAIMKYMLRPFTKTFATNYCACSALAGKWQFGAKCYNDGKVNLLKNAIDINKFTYDETVRNRVRNGLNLQGRFVVGHVGRFTYAKNHNFLIEVFCEIHKRDPNSVLLLVGGGDLFSQIHQKVKVLGLSNSVLFTGVRQDVADLMQAMDVFIFPSFYEGLGLAAIEAQAAGLPCILSDAITTEAKITDRVTFLSLSLSPEIWAETILLYKSYSQRPNTKDQIKSAGFEIKSAAKGLEEYYISCIESEKVRK